ncbi:uncharacterized protein CANTADRAFT_46495 [Suhomyces tanzawaensis NRRL Y-17324]|uniref:Cation efflux protein transmembrane domain-containing protein n=1 Tax=Suhomyces tanzawaensis NRRL Y-17324 TaxID=984487 RepID=A0A1E4SN25_9ASCO|nr:uncharacterized protein CANTADRAFT_46495 [Suhomyces tanzawaensis NRRL Y-17324]ODV80929.1 hypothetical protein CANTADRAFT_46495 [Suhomyces tanzawaensis NRRL Y-17324]
MSHQTPKSSSGAVQEPSHHQNHTHAKTPESHSHAHADSHSHGGVLSHTHTHHQPNELLQTSALSILSNPAVRITWIGLLVNVAMVVFKGFGGVYFHSQALIADAIHSVSDMVADFLTLATVNVATKVGTPINFPLGYGKIETVGSLLVSGVLLFAGVSVGWSSLLQIFEFTLPSFLYDYVATIQIGHSHSHGAPSSSPSGHSHSHSHLGSEESAPVVRDIPNINAAWLAAASIVVKELLYRKTMQVAVKTNSKVLVANAWHHRVDSLTAAVALVTVTGGVMFNVAWLDSIGGLCVSLLIIRAGWGTFKSSWFEIIDRGEKPGDETYDKVSGIVQAEVDENLNNFTISELSVMTSGANTNIYLTLKTSQSYTLKELNEFELKFESLIKKDDKFIRNVYVKFKYE